MGKGEGHGTGTGEGVGQGVGEGTGSGKGGCGCCCQKTALTIYIVVCYGIPIAIIAIIALIFIIFGAVYYDDCEEQPLIPLWCLISAATPILLLLFLWGITDDSYEITVCRVIAFLGYLVFSAWLIAGSVWIFKTYNKSDPQCHDVILRFSFWMCIITWCLFGIATLVLVYTILKIFCCRTLCNKKVDPS